MITIELFLLFYLFFDSGVSFVWGLLFLLSDVVMWHALREIFK